MPADPRVLLLGMMGAGKSTVGHAIAARTGWSYLDNDELVVRSTGRTARDILDADGEPALRAAESAALTEALRLEPPVVAGVAGGTVLVPTDRARLAEARGVVWLRAGVDTLVARVGAGVDRPWLQPDPRSAISRMVREREPLYAQVADLVVDVEHRTPEQVADVVLHTFR
jgi:shikimate kinase